MLHRPVNYAYVRTGGSPLNLGEPVVQIIAFWGVLLRDIIRNVISINFTILLLKVKQLRSRMVLTLGFQINMKFE